MDIEEYKNRKSVIDHDYNKSLRALDREFAFSNSVVRVGDIVTDHIGSVIVSDIKLSRGLGSNPACVYYGVELTKKMQAKKSGAVRGVWQENLLESKN